MKSLANTKPEEINTVLALKSIQKESWVKATNSFKCRVIKTRINIGYCEVVTINYNTTTGPSVGAALCWVVCFCNNKNVKAKTMISHICRETYSLVNRTSSTLYSSISAKTPPPVPFCPRGVGTTTSRLKEWQAEDCRDNVYNYRKISEEIDMLILLDFPTLTTWAKFSLGFSLHLQCEWNFLFPLDI